MRWYIDSPEMLPSRDPVPVLICAAMKLPLSVPAVKFNANAILMSVWPWLIYYFLRALTEPGVRFSILTGLLGALAMLGKYFSIVLLLTLLWFRSQRQWGDSGGGRQRPGRHWAPDLWSLRRTSSGLWRTVVQR